MKSMIFLLEASILRLNLAKTEVMISVVVYVFWLE